MPFKVEVGPPQIAIHNAQTVLITDPDGEVSWTSEKGLYFLDTRVISGWAIYANGEPWDLLNGGAVTAHTASIHLTNRAFLSEDGAVPARSLGFVIGRRLGGGMHEDLDVTNHGRRHGALQSRDRHPFRLRRRVRSEAEPHRTSWPHHHRMVRRSTQRLRTDLSQPGLHPCGADRRAAGGQAGHIRQWPAQLRGAARPRPRRGIAACSTT